MGILAASQFAYFRMTLAARVAALPQLARRFPQRRMGRCPVLDVFVRPGERCGRQHLAHFG
jgi:hypothetical protein